MKKILPALLFLILFSEMSVAADRQLSGSEIRTAITNRRIYLKVPLGGEFPLFYREDGYVDGSGTAVGIGLLTRVSDEGKWWISGAMLCQQWRMYEGGKRYCFTLSERADGQLAWRRDDGLDGLARIGR